MYNSLAMFCNSLKTSERHLPVIILKVGSRLQQSSSTIVGSCWRCRYLGRILIKVQVTVAQKGAKLVSASYQHQEFATRRVSRESVEFSSRRKQIVTVVRSSEILARSARLGISQHSRGRLEDLFQLAHSFSNS